MPPQLEAERLADIEHDLYDQPAIYAPAITWWNENFTRKIYQKRFADVPVPTEYAALERKFWDWDVWEAWGPDLDPPPDLRDLQLPLEMKPIIPTVPVEQTQFGAVKNRRLWCFPARVRDAMMCFPIEKDRWDSLKLKDAARILVVTAIIKRPDLDAERLGLIEDAPWESGQNEDEPFGRGFTLPTFGCRDNKNRKGGIWLDLAEFAWGLIRRNRAAPVDREPLSKRAGKVYEMLMKLEDHKALTGPEILKELDSTGEVIDMSTFTSRIVPELNPYGLKNKPRVGYFIRSTKATQ